MTWIIDYEQSTYIYCFWIHLTNNIICIFKVLRVSLFLKSMMAFAQSSGKLQTRTGNREDHMLLIFLLFSNIKMNVCNKKESEKGLEPRK